VKQKISISFIAVSVIFLLALRVLPHHHHSGQVCFVMETGEQDHTVNDEHTHHNGIPDEGHGKTCVAETEYIAPSFKDEIKCKISSCKNYDHNHIYLFPVFFLVADLLNFDTGNSFFKTAYGEHISFYKSAKAIQFNGLRAPPITLS
jgi:hypothetical protein